MAPFAVLLADSLHTGSAAGAVEPDVMGPFFRLARDAVAGRKTFVITHSEVFPGTFASTTETADYLLAALHLRRRPVLRQGPIGMQQLSWAIAGQFRVAGFAGNTAPDHMDHLYALGAWLSKKM